MISLLSLIAFLIPFSVAATQTIIIGGAGPSTDICNVFFDALQKNRDVSQYEFEVQQHSIKHTGGILSTEKRLFGRTGELIGENWQKKNKRDIILGEVPIVVTRGTKAGVTEITLTQLKDIITRKITNWKELGGNDGTIILAGREKNSKTYGAVKETYNWYADVKFDKTFKKDHQMTNFITDKRGGFALGFGAFKNFPKQFRMHVTDYKVGQRLGLVIDLKNKDHPLVKEVIDFARSEKWRNHLQAHGYFPVEAEEVFVP